MIASMQIRRPETVTDWVEVSGEREEKFRIVRLASRYSLEQWVPGGWESRGTVPAAVVEELEFRRDLADKYREELLARINGKMVKGERPAPEGGSKGYPGTTGLAISLIEVQEPLQPAAPAPLPARVARNATPPARRSRRFQSPRLPTVRTAAEEPKDSQLSLVEHLRSVPSVPIEQSPLGQSAAEIRSARCRAAWVARKKRFGPSGRS